MLGLQTMLEGSIFPWYFRASCFKGLVSRQFSVFSFPCWNQRFLLKLVLLITWAQSFTQALPCVIPMYIDDTKSAVLKSKE